MMADPMTSFDVICHHYQEKWRHLVEQAKGCLININLFSSTLTKRKPRRGLIQNPPVYFVSFFSRETGPVSVVSLAAVFSICTQRSSETMPYYLPIGFNQVSCGVAHQTQSFPSHMGAKKPQIPCILNLFQTRPTTRT